jgi:diguanylate cyclase (GGDEF)-like protein
MTTPPSEEEIVRRQTVRIRRLGMVVASYAVTATVVFTCYALGLLPGSVLVKYLLWIAALNGMFYIAFRTRLNLRLADPNLTMAQMLVCVPPTLYVMYWLASPQARSTFLLLISVPLIYGTLGLEARRLAFVAVMYVLGYLSLLFALENFRPGFAERKANIIELITLLGTSAQIALIGGYISKLRHTLSERSADLNQALLRISDMANRDELTGIANRRQLVQVINNEISRCARGGAEFSVCLIDIDFFKRINDVHGHLAGDEVLRKLASHVAGRVRDVDCFGRYGGEEFLLVMPQTTLSGAQAKAEGVRMAVASLAYEGLPPGFSITVSAGVAQHQSGESLEHLVGRADSALYRAKAEGRDRVVLAGSPTTTP